MPDSAGLEAQNSGLSRWGDTKQARLASNTSPRNKELEIEDITRSDVGYDSDIEVVRPDKIEDADVEQDSSTQERSQAYENDEVSLLERFRQLNCGSTVDMRDSGRGDRLARRTKGWSSGVLKRTYSQSNLGSDSDMDGKGSLNGQSLNSSAKRFRRRVRQPSDGSWVYRGDLLGLSVTEAEKLDGPFPADSDGVRWMEELICTDMGLPQPQDLMEIDSDVNPP